VVEDEALIALDTVDLLEQAGYTIVGVADRLDRALAMAEAGPLEAAVLDVNIAGDLVWPLAEVLQGRKVPFVLLTGLLNTSAVPRSCAFAPRLSKPVHRAALLEMLSTAIRSASLGKADGL
jgi:CheY-like chemotaxis protein